MNLLVPPPDKISFSGLSSLGNQKHLFLLKYQGVHQYGRYWVIIYPVAGIVPCIGIFFQNYQKIKLILGKDE